MSRPKGSINKLTKEVKETLQDITDKVVNSIDIEELDPNQKLKFLQISLQYLIPRLKHESNNINEDLPLFVETQVIRNTKELDLFKKVEKYEKENNVKIL